MKICYTLLLAVTLIATLSFIQRKASSHPGEKNLFFSQYDSSYDFAEIRTRNRNPKDLIGQELEFAPPSTNHAVGSKASLFYQLRDSLFICFTSPVTTKISELTNVFPEKSTGFDLVDCSRYPTNYSYQFLKDSATTNTYKPRLVVTDAYPFGIRRDENGTKKAIVVGTPYSDLAGRIFTIKDVSCYFDYYDSKVSYFFSLLDSDNNEVTLYIGYNQPLEQMIHIKGYIKKTEEKYRKNSFEFNSSFTIKIDSDSLLKGYQLNPDYFKNEISLYNQKWSLRKYKYVSTPERYFQVLYLELVNNQNEIVEVKVYDLYD